MSSQVHVMAPKEPPGPLLTNEALCTEAHADSADVVFHPNARQMLSGFWLCEDCGAHSGGGGDA